jgi:hypothetical protein
MSWRGDGGGLARENVQLVVSSHRIASHHSPVTEMTRRQGHDGETERRADGSMMDRRIAVLPDELERGFDCRGPSTEDTGMCSGLGSVLAD